MIDIGLNLTADAFAHDRDEVMQRAKANGVTHAILTGSNEIDSRAALALAKNEPDLFHSTAGIHPHHANQFTSSSETWIRELAAEKAVVAIGETGLDYNRNYSTPEEQKASFEAHLQIAVDTQLPMFLHQRDAHQDFLSLLKQYRDQLVDVVVHCFTGEEQEMLDYLELDCYIGQTGWICDERRGHHLRDFVAKIPSNRLLIETDSPYLLPRDIRPKPKSRRNEPMWLDHIADVLAHWRDEDPALLKAQTTENAQRLFRLPG